MTLSELDALLAVSVPIIAAETGWSWYTATRDTDATSGSVIDCVKKEFGYRTGRSKPVMRVSDWTCAVRMGSIVTCG